MADENGKEILDDAKEAVEEAGTSAAETTGDVVETVKEATGDAVDKGKEVAGDAVDAVKDAGAAVADKAGEAVDKGKEVAGDAADAVSGAASAAKDKVGDAIGGVTDTFDGDGDTSTVLQWLLPLLLIGLLLVIGFMFWGGGSTANEQDAPEKPAAEAEKPAEAQNPDGAN